MPPRGRFPLRGEAGFSLPELLVVCLIVGLLAALAIPQFLSQKQKSDDASAKSDARNLASLVEACSTAGTDYTDCDAPSDLPDAGLALGAGPGQVRVSDATNNSFEVTAVSRADSGGSHHRFVWAKSSGGDVSRTCTAGPGNDDGGCHGGSW